MWDLYGSGTVVSGPGVTLFDSEVQGKQTCTLEVVHEESPAPSYTFSLCWYGRNGTEAMTIGCDSANQSELVYAIRTCVRMRFKCQL